MFLISYGNSAEDIFKRIYCSERMDLPPRPSLGCCETPVRIVRTLPQWNSISIVATIYGKLGHSLQELAFTLYIWFDLCGRNARSRIGQLMLSHPAYRSSLMFITIF